MRQLRQLPDDAFAISTHRLSNIANIAFKLNNAKPSQRDTSVFSAVTAQPKEVWQAALESGVMF